MAKRKKIPALVRRTRGQEEAHEVKPPGARLGEPMPKPDSKGKVQAEESGELIVWDNRQRIP